MADPRRFDSNPDLTNFYGSSCHFLVQNKKILFVLEIFCLFSHPGSFGIRQGSGSATLGIINEFSIPDHDVVFEKNLKIVILNYTSTGILTAVL